MEVYLKLVSIRESNTFVQQALDYSEIHHIYYSNEILYKVYSA